MLNNIPAHNHTVYSYLQALLTDRHKVSNSVQPVTLTVDIMQYNKNISCDIQKSNAE